MPWTQVSASFSLILCSAVILNYSKGMVLQLGRAQVIGFVLHGGGGVTPSSPITNVNKREASTTNIPGIYPGRRRYQSILHS